VVAFIIFDSELAIELAHPINIRNSKEIREKPKEKRKVRRMTKYRCVYTTRRERNKQRE